MKIKFVTINIWHGRLLDKIIDFLKKEDPDIIAMQEVYNGSNASWGREFRTLEELKKIFISYNVSYAPLLDDVRPFGEIPFGNTVFTKFPIVDEDVTFYDVPFGKIILEELLEKREFQYVPRNLQKVVLKIFDKRIFVFNTHGIWDTHGEDNDRRLAMGRTIIEEIGDKRPLILAGDFNLQPYTKTIGNIQKYLKNVFKGELTSTFNMKRKDNPGCATAAVDMVFVSDDIKVIDRFCPDVDISDHLPLVCVFDI